MINIYTDGACSGNPGAGGYAFVAPDKREAFYGFSELTTNNRMELMALLMALKKYKLEQKFHIFSDSKYVIDSASKWVKRWYANKWKTSTGQDVKNKDLWQEYLNLTKNKRIKFTWVKGHANNVYNSLADELAVLAVKKKVRRQKRRVLI